MNSGANTDLQQQQYELKWHYQEVTFSRNLSTFLISNILTDVTLCVESENLKAHKLVLAMCSEYFFQLFQNMSDNFGSANHQPVIVLHNVSLSDIKAVLAFIYRGKCIVTKSQIASVLSVAKLLKIQGLCDMKVPDLMDEKSFSEKTAATTISINSSPNETFSEDNEPSCDKQKKKDLAETCKCFLCGKYLSNQYNLRVHMETHEEAYHACQSCPHVSRSRDALRKHVSYRHPKEYHTRKRKKIN